MAEVGEVEDRRGTRVAELVGVVARPGAGGLAGGDLQARAHEAVDDRAEHRGLAGVHRRAEDDDDRRPGPGGRGGARARPERREAVEGDPPLGIGEQAQRLKTSGHVDARVLLEHLRGEATAGDEVGRGERVGHVREELVGGVAVAVGDEDLAAGEEHLATGDGALETGVLADLDDPREDDVTGTRDDVRSVLEVVAVGGCVDGRGDEAGGVGLEHPAQPQRVQGLGVVAGGHRRGRVEDERRGLAGAVGGRRHDRLLCSCAVLAGSCVHERQITAPG